MEFQYETMSFHKDTKKQKSCDMDTRGKKKKVQVLIMRTSKYGAHIREKSDDACNIPGCKLKSVNKQENMTVNNIKYYDHT